MVGMSDKVFIVEASFDEDNENVPATIRFTNSDDGGNEDFATHYIMSQGDVEAGFSNTRFDILLIFNLCVTSKNETTNSPIHGFKVLHKGQRAF